MKKKKIIISLMIVMIVLISIVITNYDNTEHTVLKDQEKVISATSSISMMLETGASSGIYEMSSDTSWPSSGYTFNSTLSKCENGSTLVWDSTNSRVIMTGNVSDKCYVYFDVKKGSITLYSSDGELPLAGAGFYLYKVATYSDGNYIYTEDFKNCTVSLDDLSSTIANNVYSYISSNNITQNSEAIITDDGYVVFSDLESGIYLTYLSDTPAGYNLPVDQAILFKIPDSDDYDLSYTYTFSEGSVLP